MPESPRIRRLRADRKALDQLKADSTLFDFAARGEMPDTYTLLFHGTGVWRPDVGSPVQFSNRHEVYLRLGAAYPRMMPELTWRSPIFHPNISASVVVCLGGYGTYWVPSLALDELCTMLWDMIRYANYDPNSPYNRDAAIWAKQQSDYHFPLDTRPIRDRVHRQAREEIIKSRILKPSLADSSPVIPLPIPVARPLPVAQPVAPQPTSDGIEFIGEDVVEAEVVRGGSGSDEIVFIE
jgi:ubiquitin-protein ligase